ncbi:MAG: YtxH domain-containing protein [Gemmatimonadota bacterium]
MYFEDQKNTFNFVSGLIIGALVGAGIALMAAPTSGKRTRRKMLRRVLNARRAAGEHVDDWTADLRSAVRSGRRRLRT